MDGSRQRRRGTLGAGCELSGGLSAVAGNENRHGVADARGGGYGIEGAGIEDLVVVVGNNERVGAPCRGACNGAGAAGGGDRSARREHGRRARTCERSERSVCCAPLSHPRTRRDQPRPVNSDTTTTSATNAESCA